MDEFTVTPELPPGLSLDPALGTLSGAPRRLRTARVWGGGAAPGSADPGSTLNRRNGAPVYKTRCCLSLRV